jgi:hypothetical protein
MGCIHATARIEANVRATLGVHWMNDLALV